MHTLVFPFTTQDIIITSADELSDSEWETISKRVGNLITEVLRTLHPADPNSPIQKLHESGIGFPVSANDILWEFLKTAEYYHGLSLGRLNILSGTNELEVIDFDLKEMTISRTVDVKIRPHVIMSEFTADKIDQILSKSSLSNYLISAPHTYIVKGKEEWEISFLHPDTENDLDMIVSEGSAVICYPSVIRKPEEKVQQSPFSHIDTSTPLSAAIIESSNPLYSKAVGELIFDMQAAYQFQQFVEDWKCGATLLFADGTIEQYSI